MLSKLLSFIADAMKRDEVPSAPPSKNMESAIGIHEAMKSTDMDDTENLAASAAAAKKLIKRIKNMSLKRASGKPGKYIRLV